MSDRPTSGPAPRWGEYGPAPEPAPELPPPVAPAPEQPPATAARRAAPTWDRVLTIALLVFGTVNVLTGIPQMLRLPDALDEAYAMQGFGDYTAIALASAIGIAVNVVNVLLLIAAVAASIPQLRAGRIAFWIPLVAGAIALVVAVVLIGAAMIGDPALAAYLEQQTAR
ncbi:DUF6264 family protein [Naasia sp. SYSU D00948]|uniref:DUF6264 family protein n=1 Tax=Naasia sp. SYSU D00948 TaxID=2817379 RepID=UPI001B3105E3|nr:DUF6264 family protein [Naasia sp. SYSU D00948]